MRCMRSRVALWSWWISGEEKILFVLLKFEIDVAPLRSSIGQSRDHTNQIRARSSKITSMIRRFITSLLPMDR